MIKLKYKNKKDGVKMDIKKNITMEYLFKSAMYGLAIGDALGVPVEFWTRSRLKDIPINDIVGYGTYQQERGTWSDDTSLSLATLDGLITNINYKKIAQNFVNYYEKSFYCQNKMFGIDETTSSAIIKISEDIHNNTFDSRYVYGGRKQSYNTNGSLKRMIPVALYLYDHIDKYNTPDKRKKVIYRMSNMTHATSLSMFGCRLYVEYTLMLLSGMDKIKAFYKLIKQFKNEIEYYPLYLYENLLDKKFINIKQSEIKSDSYIVNSLEAAMWCFLNTNTYKNAVLKAVNLGGDTDTTASIVGGLAGIYYGYDKIPQYWVDEIYNHEIIDEILNKYFAADNSDDC